MSVISFAAIFRHSRRSRLRAVMRGYSCLKKTGQIGILRQIKTDLVDEVMPEISERASQHMFGAALAQAELVVRQILLQRHAGTAMNKAILYSMGNKSSSIVHPMPLAWRNVLKKQGLQVSDLRSSLAWAGLVASYFGYGILLVAKLAWISLWSTLRKKTAVGKRYAYLNGLTPSNLPQPDADGRSHDICTWYARWNGRMDSLDAICHGVRHSKTTLTDGISVEYIDRPFELMRGIERIARFLFWGGRAVFIVAVDMLRGRWWHALVFAESAKAKAVQLCAPDTLALDYLFHYSGTIYRPMWTYEAEKKGARIVCYFYSTSEQVKLPDGYVSQRYEWGAASWPNYLVWDNYQADVIFRDIDRNATVKVIGPVWFSTSSLDMPEIPERSIAVFDVQPHRKSAHFGISTLADYSVINAGLQLKFLEDVYEVLSAYGVTMAFKRKRDIGRKAEKKYANYVQQLSISGNVAMINPTISAIKVIERCRGIISMPFTSTALYMRDQEIPSAYYDPTGWIQRDDRGAHGIPILSEIHELRDWVGFHFC